jgi:hypothetical protein
MKRLKLGALAILLILIASACGPRVETRKLRSGREVRILEVAPTKFSDGTEALMVKYQTHQPMDDLAGLKAEAQEIWAEFKVEAERANAEGAILNANSDPPGKAHSFLLKKDSDGTWFEVGSR